MSSPFSSGIRTSVGKYKVEALLGRGGMGEVYKAFDPSLNRTVALKTIRTDTEAPGSLERFRREGRASGRLRHPLIVTVYDLGEADGVVFLVMEYLEGRSLAALLDEDKLSFEDKIRILIQMLDALEYAHNQGVVHRDIKPGNVQVLPDGSIKLLDFGIARILTAESMSLTGSIVGTLFYMAPEQLRGDKVDRRADIYSTGVVGYELLTRRRPFDGQSLTEVVLKVFNEPLPPMNTPWTQSFPEVERIVAKAMAKSAEDRYPTAQEMAGDLRAFLDGQRAAIARIEGRDAVSARLPTEVEARSPLAAPDPAQARGRGGRSRLLAPLLLGGALGVGAAGFAYWRLWGEPGSVVPVAPASLPVTTTLAPAPPSLAGVAAGEGCLEAASGESSRELAGLLREQLRKRGIAVVEGCSGADAGLRVRADVHVRPAPFGDAAARTADYVGVLEVRSAGQALRRFDFDGHVLEFGDSVARAAALRQLAERMAIRITQLRRGP